MAAMREHFITTADGARLFVRDYGDPASSPAPLFCLAGISRNSSDYHALALRQQGLRRVICPDYRGRGRSDRDPDWRHYAPEATLADMLRILAALELTRVVMIGTSLGGLIAMALNQIKPGALCGLVLNDIGPDLESASGAIIDRIGQDASQPDLATAARHLATAFPHLSYRTDAEWLDFAARTYRQGEDGLWHQDWDPAITHAFQPGATEAIDLWALFAGLAAIPTLVVLGGISTVLTETGLARMVAVKPGLKTVTVPGVGHTPHLSEPALIGVLDDFLASV